jgi:NADPH-dependent FMN reductase
MERADGLVIVAPEYNHGYCGLLKHVLDSCLKEYIHKAVGIVGVSAGPFGGTRVIENLLPVMGIRSRNDILGCEFLECPEGLRWERQAPRWLVLAPPDKFLAELVWMSKTLRYGRESVTID